jgi:Tfp pilus assembly protein PilN
VRARVNLATRPLRNENLPALLLGLAGVALVALTVRHALAVQELLPARTTALHAEVREQEAALSRLGAEIARLHRVAQPDERTLAEWKLLKGLVDRKAFSWTRLLARLEQALPPGVRLTSIAPEVKEGAVALEVTAKARTLEAGLDFVRELEALPDFEDVLPRADSEATEGVVELRYTMTYRPAAAASARPAEEPRVEAKEASRREARGEGRAR